MIVRYRFEVCDACVLGVRVRPVLVLAAELWQRSGTTGLKITVIAIKLNCYYAHIHIHPWFIA